MISKYDKLAIYINTPKVKFCCEAILRQWDGMLHHHRIAEMELEAPNRKYFTLEDFLEAVLLLETNARPGFNVGNYKYPIEWVQNCFDVDHVDPSFTINRECEPWEVYIQWGY